MNNMLKLSFLSAAFLAITATSSFAQTADHLTVKVPFEFSVGSVTLPAGVYNFQAENSGIVIVSSANSLKSVMVLTTADNTVGESTEPRVKFDKVNGAYSLTTIEIAGEPGRRIVEPKIASNRPASIGTRASAASTAKSIK